MTAPLPPRWTGVSAAAGAGAWAALLAVPLGPDGPAAGAGRLVLWGVLVVVPLLLGVLDRPGEGGARLLHAAARLQPPGAVLAAGAFMMPVGVGAGALVVPWGAVCGLVALAGVGRLAGHVRARTLTTGRVVEAAGMLMLPVGAGWLALARAGVETVYGPLITVLTAAHCHFAAFAAPVWAGGLGALVHRRPRLRVLYRPLAAGLVLGTPLVAAGIAGSAGVEAVGVGALAGSALGLAVLALAAAPGVPDRAAAFLLALSALALGVGMAWALLYRFGAATGLPSPTIPAMLPRHGAVNAFGFATLGALALRRLRRSPRQRSEP
jgi:hypothetical protein